MPPKAIVVFQLGDKMIVTDTVASKSVLPAIKPSNGGIYVVVAGFGLITSDVGLVGGTLTDH